MKKISKGIKAAKKNIYNGGQFKEIFMKTLALWLLLIFLAVSLVSCSGMTITEKFDKTPASAKSSATSKTTGEGRSTFMFSYRGEKFICIKGSDGKFYVVGKASPSSPSMPILVFPKDNEGSK